MSYFSAASGGEDSGPMNVDRPTQAVEPEQSAVVDQAMQSPPTSTSQDLGEDLYGAAAVQPGHSSQMLAEANEAWILEAQDVFASVEACICPYAEYVSLTYRLPIYRSRKTWTFRNRVQCWRAKPSAPQKVRPPCS